MKPHLVQMPPGGNVPDTRGPFAALIDASCQHPRDIFLKDIKSLLGMGCIFFVCSGSQGIVLHDLIDDIACGLERDDVCTTHHLNETPEQVRNFFLTGVLQAMNLDYGVIYSKNPEILRAFL